MPVKKVEIPPGVDRESTQQSSGPQWYDANNVRFRDRFPQTVGGWIDDETQDMLGLARNIHSWTTFEGDTFRIIGTSWKYYITSGNTLTDITPIRSVNVDLTDDLSVTDTESIVTVSHASHGLAINDFVRFTAVGADLGTTITAAILTANLEGWQVLDVPTEDTWTFQSNINATSSDLPMIAAVTAQYLATSGTVAPTTGSGFGVGPFGGDIFTPTPYALDGLICTVTGGAFQLVTFLAATNAPDPFVATDSEDWIYVFGLDDDPVNGLNLGYLNNKWWNVTAVDGSVNPIVNLGWNPGGTPASGGVQGSYYMYDGSVGAVYGATRGWNDASSSSIGTNAMRTMSIDNFGEDVIVSNRGGPLYYYDTSLNTSSAVPSPTLPLLEINETNFTGSAAPPVIVDSFIISQGHGHVVAFGCNDIGALTQNRMLVRWSDRHNPFTWMPTASGEAGGDVLRSGNEIRGGIATKDEIVIFTDTSLYSMRYVGSPEIYGIQLISANSPSYSRMSAVAVDNSVYFMGNEQFYAYSGSVQPLPKNLSNYVFDDMNISMKAKVFAGVNSAFTEVLWFYPSGTSFECDKYVAFNYANGTWTMGSYDMVSLTEGSANTSGANLNRTSWEDTTVFANPTASYVLEYDPVATADQPETQLSRMMSHESGTSANGEPIEHHIESGEVDLDDGYHYAFYDKLLPDIQLFNVENNVDASLTASMQGRDLPGKAQKAASSISITDFSDASGASDSQNPVSYAPDFNATTIRGRARSVSIKIESSGTGFGWRAGTMRIRVRPDGKD
jgi:hypothetical protein